MIDIGQSYLTEITVRNEVHTENILIGTVFLTLISRGARWNHILLRISCLITMLLISVSEWKYSCGNLTYNKFFQGTEVNLFYCMHFHREPFFLATNSIKNMIPLCSSGNNFEIRFPQKHFHWEPHLKQLFPGEPYF
jgi:hypothetical protein